MLPQAVKYEDYLFSDYEEMLTCEKNVFISMSSRKYCLTVTGVLCLLPYNFPCFETDLLSLGWWFSPQLFS